MKRFLGVLALFCLCVSVSYGQSTSATVDGRVVDTSGKLIVGAHVEVINNATNGTYKSDTNSDGIYSVLNLIPGSYHIRVSKDGFKTIVHPDITLNVQDTLTITFTLPIGAVSETVTVAGGASMINSTDGTVATVVDRQFVENLPLNGRSFQTLILLTPGVVLAPANGVNVSGSFSINGQRTSSNGFTVDGVSANFSASPGVFNNYETSGNIPALSVLGTTQTLASVDALQEFKVQTSTYAAEYGPQPGGQIAIVTRSGTNQYHGDVFEYLRNTDFDANNWFVNRAATVPGILAMRAPEHQNDFGGVLGGPIRIPNLYNGHDRTFFFVTYEGLRLLQPSLAITNVPDLCSRGLAPATGPTSCAALPASGNVPGAAAVLPILNAFPLPPTGAALTDLGNGWAVFSPGYSNPSSINTTAVRIDHTVNSKLTIFGRYNYSPSVSTPRAGQDLAVTTPQQLGTWTLTGGATWLISPLVSNDFRINLSSNNAAQQQQQTTFGGSVPVASSLVIPPVYNTAPNVQATAFFSVPTGSLASLAIPGFTSTALPNLNPYGDVITSQHQFTIVDHVSYIRGAHQFKFGVEVRRETPVVAPNVYIAFGFFDVGTSTKTINISSGSAQTETIQSGLAAFPIFDNYATFAEDTWKISRRLTLDLGVRWDIVPSPGEKNGNISAAIDQITNLATSTIAPLGTKQWATTYHNFSPRLGFAYQLRQAPGHETVIRGGFGTFYDTGTDTSTQGQARYPYSGSRSLCSQLIPSGSLVPNCAASATQTNLTYPLQASLVAPLAVPVPLTPPFTGANANTFFDPHLQLPITYEWNLAVQQALGRSQTFTATYVGAAGRKLLTSTTDTLSISVKNPNWPSLGLTTNKSSSDYDALQLQFQRRLSRGLQALVSYTWEHSLDNDSSTGSGIVPQRGNSSFDIRQLLGVATTYDLPVPVHSGLPYAILGGWAMDSNFHAQTAPPVDINATNITDPATGLFEAIRATVVPGIPVYTSGACTPPTNTTPGVSNTLCPGGRRLNNNANDITAAQAAAVGCAAPTVTNNKGPFCTPAVVGGVQTQGNLGRLQVRALGAWQLDEALMKTFKVTEKLHLEVRAEAFNVLNHPNFGALSTILSSSTFGQASNMLGTQLAGISALYQIGGPRSLQFAMKLKF